MFPEFLRKAIFWASDAVFGPWTMALLFGTGLFLTFRLRFVQIVRFGDAVRAMVPSGDSATSGALSPFQSFMTALGATIGTGNIAGVATAVVTGGPGAVFWIWAYGFFATAIKFTEAVLGLEFRVVGGQGLSAGPMHYLRDGMKMPRLGWIYALIAGIAALTTTPVHPAQLDRGGLAEPVRHPHLGVGPDHRGAGLARDHRRHQVDRPRRGEAGAPQGRPLPGRRARRDRHPRGRAAGRLRPHPARGLLARARSSAAPRASG